MCSMCSVGSTYVGKLERRALCWDKTIKILIKLMRRSVLFMRIARNVIISYIMPKKMLFGETIWAG